MNKKLISAFLVGTLALVGCASQVPLPSPDDATYPAYVASAEKDVKTYTTIFTGVYVLIGDEDDKSKNAKLANHLAKEISKAADSDLTLVGLKTYAFNLIAENVG